MDARTTPFTRIDSARAAYVDRAMLDSLSRHDAHAERLLDRLLSTLGFEHQAAGCTGTARIGRRASAS